LKKNSGVIEESLFTGFGKKSEDEAEDKWAAKYFSSLANKAGPAFKKK